MTERRSKVIWDSQRELANNQPRNLPARLGGVTTDGDSLVPTRRAGNAVYVYDFGGIGEVGEVEWRGEGFVSFRYKVADTLEELEQTEFVRTVIDRFQGSVIDTDQWQSLPGPYYIVQNNSLTISGETDDDISVYEETGILETVDTTEFPAAFAVDMKLDRVGKSSGGEVFLAITDGVNTLKVRKFYEQLQNSAIRRVRNGQVEWLPNDTNIDNISTVVVTRNGTVVFEDENARQLSDGILEQIDFEDIPTNAIDTLVDLKRYARVTDVQTSPTPYADTIEGIPFSVRADYNPTGRVGDVRPYIHYDVKRDVGFYRATVPLVNRQIDLHEAELESFNWNSETKTYELADTDNVWKIALTLPPGTHRYKFDADGIEFVDVTNPNSFYLDPETGEKKNIFDADGYGYGYGYGPPPIPEGVVSFSELVIDETQTVEFVFQRAAKRVSLIGTFNDYDSNLHPMAQRVDRQLIRRLCDPNFTYINDNRDYHKIEITLPYRTSIDTIDFKTLVPVNLRQRVKIWLDDIPVSRLDWNLVPGNAVQDDIVRRIGFGLPIDTIDHFGYGYGYEMACAYGTAYGNSFGYEGAAYGGYGYVCDPSGYLGYGQGIQTECSLTPRACDEIFATSTTFSYWDNTTDTITAAEDDIIRWCLKKDQVRTAKKITFVSRIEGAPDVLRQHVLLDFYAGKDEAVQVSDYALSDAYATVQGTHTVQANTLRQWQLPVANLYQEGAILEPKTYDQEGNPVFGAPITVEVDEAKPTAWELNKSNLASGSLEIIYGIAGRLRAPPLRLYSAIDDRSLNTDPIEQPEDRFVDLRIPYIVRLDNVQIDPEIVLFVKMEGLVDTFQLVFYETREDAANNQNDIGILKAREYGIQTLADFEGTPAPDGRLGFFALDKTLTIHGMERPVTVGNIVATYQRGGSDQILRVEKVR